MIVDLLDQFETKSMVGYRAASRNAAERAREV
jgi:hypothetical protein